MSQCSDFWNKSPRNISCFSKIGKKCMRVPLWLEWSLQSLIRCTQRQLQKRRAWLCLCVYLCVFVINNVGSLLGSFAGMLRRRWLCQALRSLLGKGWNPAACSQVPWTPLYPQGLCTPLLPDSGQPDAQGLGPSRCPNKYLWDIFCPNFAIWICVFLSTSPS